MTHHTAYRFRHLFTIAWIMLFIIFYVLYIGPALRIVIERDWANWLDPLTHLLRSIYTRRAMPGTNIQFVDTGAQLLGLQIFDDLFDTEKASHIALSVISTFPIIACFVLLAPLRRTQNIVATTPLTTPSLLAAAYLIATIGLAWFCVVLTLVSFDLFSQFNQCTYKWMARSPLHELYGNFTPAPYLLVFTICYALAIPTLRRTLRGCVRVKVLERISFILIVASVPLALLSLVTLILGEATCSYTVFYLAITTLLAASYCRLRLLYNHPRLTAENPVPECHACGYDLRGTVAAHLTQCPECGATIIATH